MIHYHGAPCPGNAESQVKFFRHRDALLSYANRKKVSAEVIFDICRSFILDNGAFTYWKNNEEPKWDDFYCWVENYRFHPRFQWFLVPDIIGGSVEENNKQLVICPMPINITVPVFHVGEPLDRIMMIIEKGYHCIGIGTTPGFELKSAAFFNEMRKIFETVCNHEGIPKIKVHGLRMLDPEIVREFPFSSCDSATSAMESIFDCKWGHRYFPKTQSGRAALVADYLESSQSPSFYKSKPIQMDLL